MGATKQPLRRVLDFGNFNSAHTGEKLAKLVCGHTIGVGNNCFRNYLRCWKCKEEQMREGIAASRFAAPS